MRIMRSLKRSSPVAHSTKQPRKGHVMTPKRSYTNSRSMREQETEHEHKEEDKKEEKERRRGTRGRSLYLYLRQHTYLHASNIHSRNGNKRARLQTESSLLPKILFTILLDDAPGTKKSGRGKERNTFSL